MPDAVRDTIYQFSQQIKKLFGQHVSKIIVYGSYARGDYQNDVYDIAFEIEMSTGIDISPVVKNETQYEYWVDVLPYYRNVQEEGVVVSG